MLNNQMVYIYIHTIYLNVLFCVSVLFFWWRQLTPEFWGKPNMPKRPNMVAQPELCRCLGSTSGVGGRFMESIALLVSGHTMPCHYTTLHYNTIHTYIHIDTDIHIHTCIYIYVCMYMWVRAYVYPYVHIFNRVNVCVYKCIYIYHRRRLLSINPSHLTSISFSCSSI